MAKKRKPAKGKHVKKRPKTKTRARRLFKKQKRKNAGRGPRITQVGGTRKPTAKPKQTRQKPRTGQARQPKPVRLPVKRKQHVSARAKLKAEFRPVKESPPARQRISPTPIVGDEDELEEWAEQWGVSADEAEDLLEYIEQSTNLFDPPLDDYGRPDDDYMNELADSLDIDVSDLYDMYYGYPPGSHGARG